MSVRILTTLITILVSTQNGRTASTSDEINSILDTVKTLYPVPEHPDAFLNFTQLAAKYGHPAEQYVVFTEDGYSLKIFHLPGKGYGLPILLFHGLGDSSDTWIIRGRESLAIHLANAGYDVWLGNVRGNKYSQEDVPPSLNQNATYWNFTFYEHAIYDLPTTIDLVLKKTGASKVNSIGHSQGTSIHFILLSTILEYNEKVNLLICLAPVAYLHHAPPPLGVGLRLAPELYDILKAAKQYDIFAKTSPTEVLERKVCSTTFTSYFVCLLGGLFQFTGYDVRQIDPEFSFIAFQHTPTATSIKNALYYGQITIRKSFAPFDYGKEGNLAAYNSVEPPEYKLENIKTKIVLLTARNDPFSTQADVAILRRRLSSVVRFVVNPRRQMNHLDYVWGQNMTTYLFPYIFDSLNLYG